jgi:hypothetical protein
MDIPISWAMLGHSFPGLRNKAYTNVGFVLAFFRAFSSLA